MLRTAAEGSCSEAHRQGLRRACKGVMDRSVHTQKHTALYVLLHLWVHNRVPEGNGPDSIRKYGMTLQDDKRPAGQSVHLPKLGHQASSRKHRSKLQTIYKQGSTHHADKERGGRGAAEKGGQPDGSCIRPEGTERDHPELPACLDQRENRIMRKIPGKERRWEDGGWDDGRIGGWAEGRVGGRQGCVSVCVRAHTCMHAEREGEKACASGRTSNAGEQWGGCARTGTWLCGHHPVQTGSEKISRIRSQLLSCRGT